MISHIEWVVRKLPKDKAKRIECSGNYVANFHKYLREGTEADYIDLRRGKVPCLPKSKHIVVD